MKTAQQAVRLMVAVWLLSIALCLSADSSSARGIRLTDYLRAEGDSGTQQAAPRPQAPSATGQVPQRQSNSGIARPRLQPLGRLEVEVRHSASGARPGAGASGSGAGSGHPWTSLQRVQPSSGSGAVSGSGPRSIPRGVPGVLNVTRAELRGGKSRVGDLEGCEAREFVQVVRARGCRPAFVRNRFCIGVCASLFVPQESEFVPSQTQAARTQQRGPRDTLTRAQQPTALAIGSENSSQTANAGSESLQEDLVEAIPRPKRQSSVVANVDPTTILQESNSAGPAAQLVPDDGDVRHTRVSVTRARSCRPVWLSSASSALSNPPASLARGVNGGGGESSSSVAASGGSGGNEWLAVRLECPARPERSITKIVHIVHSCQCAA